MSIEAWILIVIFSAILVGWLVLRWTEPNDLAIVRQRERALQAMAKWSE